MKMRKIEISIPRDDEKLMCDLLHLNGFPTRVERPEGRPVVVHIHIEDDQFQGADSEMIGEAAFLLSKARC